MSENRQGTVITTLGLQLLAKLASIEGTALEFAGVEIGTGSPGEGVNLSELTELFSYKMDGKIAEYGYDETAKDGYIVMQITNHTVQTGFVMTEIGLYAKDPDLGRILYAYLDLSDDPNYIMPAENGRSKIVQMKLHVIVGETKDIHATIDPISQVTYEKFQKEIARLDKRLGELGRVLIGNEDTELENNDTLFIVEGIPKPARFCGAVYSNLVFEEREPETENGGLWAKKEGGNLLRASPMDGSQGEAVIEGKLSVSGQAAPDADFFAKIL